MADPQGEDQANAMTGAYIVALYGTWEAYGMAWYIGQPPMDVKYILDKEAILWLIATSLSKGMHPINITKVRVAKV